VDAVSLLAGAVDLLFLFLTGALTGAEAVKIKK